MKYRILVTLITVSCLSLAGLSRSAEAGETIDAITSRGFVRCGVSEGIAGFSEKNASGRWTGFDADFCRAVAAAALGNAEKVIFVPLKASERFPALQNRAVDLLLRNTTWTLGREAGLKLQFPGILFYDGQAFMVPKKADTKNITQLNGATICIEKGTTHANNLADFFDARSMKVTPLVLDSSADIKAAFSSGRCSAYTSDASQLASVRLRLPGGPNSFEILPDRISKEPLGPVVRRGDDDWVTLVRWVLFSLIAAEEAGLTRGNIEATIKEKRNHSLRSAVGLEGGVGKSLGVSDDWAVRVVKSVGNYGEMFERNVGRESPLKLDRGLNRLWTEGGMLYAPPLR